jgi:hypothetical protein
LSTVKHFTIISRLLSRFPMRDYSERFKRFVHSIHSYRRATFVTAFLTIIVFGLGLTYLLPNADSASVQAGLTVIAEILGVLLGAVLVVVVLLIEQGHQAEELLRRAFPKYRRLIDSHSEQIDLGRQQLIEEVKSGQIQFDDPAFLGPSGIPAPAKYRDVIANLSALALAVNGAMLDTVEQELDDLGYSEDEKSHILYGMGITADYNPVDFLRLADDALDLRYVSPYEVSDLAIKVFEGYSHDGINKALSQFTRSQSVLRSIFLAATIAILTLTTVGATLTLFGITDETVIVPFYIRIVAFIVMGFVISVLLALFLIEKMFT